MRIDVGIIGGTGVGDRLLALGGRALHVPTERGLLRGNAIELGGRKVLLIGRHSAGHKVPPHKVNYAAMALGLKALGATTCFATAAVGGLRPDWYPGDLVICDDFLDYSGRNPTLFDRVVRHTDFTEPFGHRGRKALRDSAADRNIRAHHGGTYLCGNGPRYETPEEIRQYHKFGADVVGMTAATEAILMREAGIDYACLAIVTNLAAGISPTPLTHEEVVEMMDRTGPVVVELLEAAVARVEL